MSELGEAAASGDRRRALEALRDDLVRALEVAETKEVAGLSRELRIVLSELDSLTTGEAGDSVDDLAARRAARRKAAANQGDAAGSE